MPFGAESFSPQAEAVFKNLQIIAAIADGFAHGTNDMANAMGPFAAIYLTYQTGAVPDKLEELGDDRWWIMACGGAGLVAGLVLFGHLLINRMGSNYMYHSPARGFCVELSSAFIVLLGSYLRLPLSTTHCQVGAQTGVAKASHHEQSNERPYNRRQLEKIIVAFLLTMFVSGVLSSALFAFGAYSPSA